MNLQWFGPTIDIHGGGADLIFPHHECEIAQSVNFTAREPFARYWVHTAMVGFEGEKMSKSLGNLVMVDRLLQQYTPDSIRLYLASHHYRRPWEFTFRELDESLIRCSEMAQAVGVVGGQGASLSSGPARERFERALDDDLNTPEACEVLCHFGNEILSACDERRDVSEAQSWLRAASSVLGLRLTSKGPEESVSAGWERHIARFANGSSLQ